MRSDTTIAASAIAAVADEAACDIDITASSVAQLRVLRAVLVAERQRRFHCRRRGGLACRRGSGTGRRGTCGNTVWDSEIE